MAKKPNAANITHALSQLGGGAKKDGGGGMLGGIQNIFAAGFQAGQLPPGEQPAPKSIEPPEVLSLENGSGDK